MQQRTAVWSAQQAGKVIFSDYVASAWSGKQRSERQKIYVCTALQRVTFDRDTICPTVGGLVLVQLLRSCLHCRSLTMTAVVPQVYMSFDFTSFSRIPPPARVVVFTAIKHRTRVVSNATADAGGTCPLKKNQSGKNLFTTKKHLRKFLGRGNPLALIGGNLAAEFGVGPGSTGSPPKNTQSSDVPTRLLYTSTKPHVSGILRIFPTVEHLRCVQKSKGYTAVQQHSIRCEFKR